MVFGCSAELASKPEWSVLQSIEQEYRNKKFTEPEILNVRGHEVLGVRGKSGQRVWILLNPQASPFYKQMPQGSFEISPELLELIRTSGSASETVLECLASHISISESSPH
jgi:hypothetical protein